MSKYNIRTAGDHQETRDLWLQPNLMARLTLKKMNRRLFSNKRKPVHILINDMTIEYHAVIVHYLKIREEFEGLMLREHTLLARLVVLSAIWALFGFYLCFLWFSLFFLFFFTVYSDWPCALYIYFFLINIFVGSSQP